jgi:hypothetical protein
MRTLPDEIRAYLVIRADARMLASLRERHPDLEERMNSPDTRRALVSWLGGDEARAQEHAPLTAAALKFLYSARDDEEAAVVTALLEHPSALVRLRSFEALLIPLFADRQIERLKPLLRTMLADADDLVRSAGARYMERSGTADDLRPFLEAWRTAAPARGWESTESFELVTRLLGEA